MTVASTSQSRPSVGTLALQQVVNASAASFLALQESRFSAAGSLSAEKDLALVDATSGAVTLTMPALADAILGKPYIVKESSGVNAVTVDGYGSETIDGASTFVVAAGDCATFIATEHPTTHARTWHTIAVTAGVGAKVYMTADVTDLLAANTQVRGLIYLGPPARVTRIDSVLLDAALTAGNATLTARIGTTAMTNGVITITQSGSAVGDKDTATPTALNTVATGDWVNVIVGGSNTAAASEAAVTFEFTVI